jgi:hypothetical protein
MNIFERATRAKLRYDSTIGLLSTEQLWDLPLVARGDRPDLDKVARAAYQALKVLEEGSFVDVKPDPRRADAELRLEVVKHVIAARQAEAAAAVKAMETKERKAKLLEALANKEVATLSGMSEVQLKEELAKLEG